MLGVVGELMYDIHWLLNSYSLYSQSHVHNNSQSTSTKMGNTKRNINIQQEQQREKSHCGNCALFLSMTFREPGSDSSMTGRWVPTQSQIQPVSHPLLHCCSVSSLVSFPLLCCSQSLSRCSLEEAFLGMWRGLGDSPGSHDLLPFLQSHSLLWTGRRCNKATERVLIWAAFLLAFYCLHLALRERLSAFVVSEAHHRNIWSDDAH